MRPTTVIALMVLAFARTCPELRSQGRTSRNTPPPIHAIGLRAAIGRSYRGSASACELSQMSVALTRQTSLLEQLLQATINPVYDEIGE